MCLKVCVRHLRYLLWTRDILDFFQILRGCLVGRTRLVLFVVGSRATISALSETVARQATAVADKSWATLCIHQISKAASSDVFLW